MKQIFKITTLGILFFFVCTLQLSAQKCKFAYSKTDPISGEMTKGNMLTISVMTYYWKIGFNRIGDSFDLGMFIRISTTAREILQKGDPLILRLANGEIITINSIDEFLPSAQVSGAGTTSARILTEYRGKFYIDAASLQKIADSPPTFIRMNIESKVYEKEITAKDGKKVSQAARCILQ
jgi:hypothetical protein